VTTALPLTLHHTQIGDRTVVRVGGDVDAYTAPHLRTELFALLRAGANHLVIDLDGVDFMDSSGLGVLITLRRRLSGTGGSVCVVCTREPICRIFRITSLDRAVPVHSSTEEALAGGN
jgi:anti-sigma B factor antagonist